MRRESPPLPDRRRVHVRVDLGPQHVREGSAEPVRTIIAGISWTNAAQMPATIARLPADAGVEELQILEDDSVAEQVLPQRLISKLSLASVPTCDKPSTIVMSLTGTHDSNRMMVTRCVPPQLVD